MGWMHEATRWVTIPMLFCVGCQAMKWADSDVPTVETSPLIATSHRATIERQGPNKFLVKCDNVETVAVVQREPTWCWAACAEMILRYSGQSLSQEKIAETLKLRATDPGKVQWADPVAIWLAMNPDLREEFDRRLKQWEGKTKTNDGEIIFSLQISKFDDMVNLLASPSTDAIVQEISSGQPLVMGLHGGQWGGGHVVLVYGAEYSRMKTDGQAAYRDLTTIEHRFSPQYAIHKLMIVDPQPEVGKSQLLVLDAQELKSAIDFVIGKSDARKQFTSWMKVVHPTPEEMEQASKGGLTMVIKSDPNAPQPEKKERPLVVKKKKK